MEDGKTNKDLNPGGVRGRSSLVKPKFVAERCIFTVARNCSEPGRICALAEDASMGGLRVFALDDLPCSRAVRQPMPSVGVASVMLLRNNRLNRHATRTVAEPLLTDELHAPAYLLG